ncbi:MAG: TetR/AcrR family transcriptional regulator [Caldilineaceae bacterium]
MARTADPTLRATILQAARTVFQQKGYADARMADIAAVAEVAVGTIYLYFRTKDALVMALADDFHRRLLEESIPELLKGDFATAIAQSLRTTLSLMHDHQDLLAMVYLQMGLATCNEPSAVEAELTSALTAALAERMARGEARCYDPEKAALLIIGLVERAVLTSVLEGEASMSLLAETLVPFVQHALIADQLGSKAAEKG